MSSAGKENWERKCIDILQNVGLNDCDDVNNISIKEKMWNLDQEIWYSVIWNDKRNINGNKLRLYTLFNERVEPEVYVTMNMSCNVRSVLSKVRCASLHL